MQKPILAAVIAAFAALPAMAGTQVVCVHPVEPHGTTGAKVGAYALTWESGVAAGKHEWKAANCDTASACSPIVSGSYVFIDTNMKSVAPQRLPAANTCALFRDGQLDKSNPFNVSTGVAASGLPWNSGHRFAWPE